MPWWGIALARGPSFNDTDISAARELLGYHAIQQAQARSQGAPSEERALVQALAQRFSDDPYARRQPLARSYVQAMRAVYERYPNDPDAATLYAESLMDLSAWRLWTPSGRPAPQTDQILSVLDGVLRHWPDHIGANHYLVHALEASPFPQRALASARKLEYLAPAAGHLLHMPAHIYMRLGRYEAAVRSTRAAEAADDRYLAEKTIVNASYVEGYAEHNVQFLADAAAMEGDFKTSLAAAERLADKTRPNQIAYQSLRFLVMVRFARWQQLLALPRPSGDLPGTQLFWHYARGCALAAGGHPRAAQMEMAAMEQAWSRIVQHRLLPHMGSWPAMNTLAIDCLSARIAAAKGDVISELRDWRAAVAAENAMSYHEPPAWYPVRESLGNALLGARDYPAAVAAFQACLAAVPSDPRALFGLSHALAAEGRIAAARQTRRAFAHAWKGASAPEIP